MRGLVTIVLISLLLIFDLALNSGSELKAMAIYAERR
jgi:hypothetical protein